jgi:SAM-dependent methyltransferase
VTDEELLRCYLERGAPEAARWNLSPECAYIDFRARAWLRDQLAAMRPRGARGDGLELCNIGIGVGDWDDYCAHLLGDGGRVTSVDIDPAACARLRYRQLRERHPYPCHVLATDILRGALAAGAFDLVTMIGSTAAETGDRRGALAAAARLVAGGGRLFHVDCEEERAAAEATELLRELGLRPITRERDDRLAGLSIHLLVAERRPPATAMSVVK